MRGLVLANERVRAIRKIDGKYERNGKSISLYIIGSTICMLTFLPDRNTSSNNELPPVEDALWCVS